MKAVIELYQNQNILNSRTLDKVLIISPLSYYPNISFEFNAMEHTIGLDSTLNYILITVQDMPVLIEPYYNSFINYNIDTNAIRKSIHPYYMNQPIVPRTGYESDTWYVILQKGNYEIINITDSIELYNDYERAFLNIDKKIFPCEE